MPKSHHLSLLKKLSLSCMNLTSGQALLFNYNRAFDQSNIQPNSKSCQVAWLEGRSVWNADTVICLSLLLRAELSIIYEVLLRLCCVIFLLYVVQK